MDPLGGIASTIAIVKAISSTYKAIQHLKGHPKEFDEVNQNLPLVQNTLDVAYGRLRDVDLDEPSRKAIEPIVNGCKLKAEKIRDIFTTMEREKDGSILDFYRTTLLRLGKAHRVETLMQEMLEGLKFLAVHHIFKTATQSQMAKLEEAIDRLSHVESSVSDSDFESFRTQINQNIAEGGTGNQAINNGDGQTNIGDYNFNAAGGGIMNIGRDIMQLMQQNR